MLGSKKILRYIILLIFILAVTLFNTACVQTPASARELNGLRVQMTATPVVDDGSVIGSTDGIVIMGFVIVLITIIPMLLRRKSK